jgi:hypothetical protein
MKTTDKQMIRRLILHSIIRCKKGVSEAGQHVAGGATVALSHRCWTVVAALVIGVCDVGRAQTTGEECPSMHASDSVFKCHNGQASHSIRTLFRSQPGRTLSPSPYRAFNHQIASTTPMFRSLCSRPMYPSWQPRRGARHSRFVRGGAGSVANSAAES